MNSEIIENNIDLNVIEQEMGRIEDLYMTKERRMTDYFNRMSDEEYEANWEAKHVELERLGFPISKKQNLIYDILKSLSELQELDHTEAFSDIKTKSI